jgi:phage-related protein
MLKKKNMDRVAKIHGWLCRSEGYEHLEFYDKMPKRVWGKHINHWTYSEVCIEKIIPLEIMPELKWEDEPVEVELTIGVTFSTVEKLKKENGK